MRSLKWYMAVDLLILTIIGCVLEGIVTKACGYVFTSAPTITISLLIVIVAMARWNWWGVLIAPMLALANYIGGRYIGIVYLEAVYGWEVYVSSLIAMLTLVYNVLLFKKYRAKNLFMNAGTAAGIMILSYLVYCTVQFVVYRLICSGTLAHSGMKVFEYNHIDDGILTIKSVNLYRIGEGGFTFNLVGMIVAIVGAIILRSQGVICNVKDKLIDDKKNAELNRINTENFTIEEASSDEESSEK